MTLYVDYILPPQIDLAVTAVVVLGKGCTAVVQSTTNVHFSIKAGRTRQALQCPAVYFHKSPCSAKQHNFEKNCSCHFTTKHKHSKNKQTTKTRVRLVRLSLQGPSGWRKRRSRPRTTRPGLPYPKPHLVPCTAHAELNIHCARSWLYAN